jgi:hypothetical protein
MSTNKPSLKERISGLERLALYGGAMVVAGLALETGVAAFFPGSRSWLEIFLSVAADALVAIGVFGEIFFSHKAREAGDDLQRESDERVAAAEARAAEAQLETERLRAQFSWRGFSIDQASKLVEVLEKTPGKVAIEYFENDPDSSSLARQFAVIFRWSKWAVTSHAGSYGTNLWFGIVVPEPDGKSDSAPFALSIREAFETAGIGFDTAPLPRWNSSTDDMPINLGGSAARIFIGPKAPVFQPIATTSASNDKLALAAADSITKNHTDFSN